MFWQRFGLVVLATWLVLVFGKPLDDDGLDSQEKPKTVNETMLNERKEKCLQKPSYGKCTGRRLLWYFNPIFDTCQRFVYSNCGGNENSFSNHADCMKFCSQYNLRSLVLKDLFEGTK